MLINTVPNDCLMYIGFYLFIFFNITPIVNVFMLSIEKKIIEVISKSVDIRIN